MKKFFKLIGIILLVIVFIFVVMLTYFITISPMIEKHKKYYSTERYEEISSINNNKSLVGLSENEIIDLLGEPQYKHIVEPKDIGVSYYKYVAGSIYKKTMFGNTYGYKYYNFIVCFNKNGIVINTFIKEST